MEMKRQKKKKEKEFNISQTRTQPEVPTGSATTVSESQTRFWSIAVKRSVLSSRLSVRNEMRCSFFLSFFFLDGACISLYQGRQRDFSAGPNARARPLEREKRREEKKQDFNDVVIVNCGASIESRCRDRGARCTHFQNKKKKKKNKAKKKMTMVRVCKATTPFFFSFSWPSSAKTSSYSSSSSNARSICFSRG